MQFHFLFKNTTKGKFAELTKTFSVHEQLEKVGYFPGLQMRLEKGQKKFS